MLNLKFSIGTKLAISAGLSVLLVCGMLANQQLSTMSVERTNAAVANQLLTVEDALAAGADIRFMQMAYRDMRLAHALDEVDKAIARTRDSAADATKHLEAAAQRAVRPENRDRFRKLITLTADYVAATLKIGEAQKDFLRTGPARTGIAVAWTKPYEELMASPALAELANRREVELAIAGAHLKFFDVRVAAWRWAASFEPELIERVNRSIASTMAGLGQARKLTTDKAVLDGIDRLEKTAGPFKGLVEQAAQAVKQMIESTDVAVRVRAEMDEVLTQATAIAKQIAEDRKAEAASEMSQAAWIGLAVGIFVIGILAGAAVFGRLSIAVPIRKVGEVLTELSTGNKQVDIPYTSRGDEVGDAARAAGNFRDSLVRMEKLEAEQRETEARAAAEKRIADERAAAEKQAPSKRPRRSARPRCIGSPTTSRRRSAASSTACRRPRPSSKPPPAR